MAIKKLLFVDTNIWLDFYRHRNESGLELLNSLEQIQDRVIVTFQVESEFKTNRQTVIRDSVKELKALPPISRPGIFSDAKAAEMVNTDLKHANQQLAGLRKRLIRALDNPTAHDEVYKVCQRIFHKKDGLVLTREDKVRHLIRRKAFRRFLHNCPPRKASDVSIGDAFNWEWMIYCATENNAELVIVSRDQDYGIEIENKLYINDHLKQEFSERVSQKRKILLYTKLSEALKHFEVPVTEAESESEEEVIKDSRSSRSEAGQVRTSNLDELMEALKTSLAVRGKHSIHVSSDPVDNE
jgi:predicted nucleic acid-binding protein